MEEEESSFDRGPFLRFINTWVFAFLDILDLLLCPVFAILDSLLESDPPPCYCHLQSEQSPDLGIKQMLRLENEPGSGCERRELRLCKSVAESIDDSEGLGLGKQVTRSKPEKYDLGLGKKVAGSKAEKEDFGLDKQVTEPNGQHLNDFSNGNDLRGPAESWNGMSQTMHASLRRRDSLFPSRLLPMRKNVTTFKKGARWTDCRCEKCTAWEKEEAQLLYVHVDDKDFQVSTSGEDAPPNPKVNNVIFLHGFLSSSSFWVHSVMSVLPQSVRSSHRLFAVDILGFGKSPKPATSMYTLADHVEAIQQSVMEKHGIQSFHLVAHSMGCTIALALGAKFAAQLKSMTLIAPPYHPGPDFMQKIAVRSVWPPLTFGSSVMSWYEHIGRVVCFVVCKSHRLWEPLVLLLKSALIRDRIPMACVEDFTRHTHHSAWHNFHNTICSGSFASDDCLKVLHASGQRVKVIHGTNDAVIPFRCSLNLRERYSNLILTTVHSADHGGVVFGREQELARELADEILGTAVP